MQVAEGMLVTVGAPATEGTPATAKTQQQLDSKNSDGITSENSRGNRTLSIKKPQMSPFFKIILTIKM